MNSGGETFRETVLSEKAKEGEEDSFRALGDSHSYEQTGGRSEQTSETQWQKGEGETKKVPWQKARERPFPERLPGYLG